MGYQNRNWKLCLPLMETATSELHKVFNSIKNTGIIEIIELKVSSKTLKSATEKLLRKGGKYKNLWELPDLVRGAILTTDVLHTIEAVQWLRRHTQVLGLEIKKGGGENPYKGAAHLDIQLGHLSVEIQVMPASTWSVRNRAHSLYKAGNAHKSASLWTKVEDLPWL